MSTQTYPWSNTRRSSFTIERTSWSLRLWLAAAFLLAILFHWWLYYFFNNIEFGQQMLPQEPLKPQAERIAINPEALRDQKAITTIPDEIAPSDMAEPQLKADLQDIAEMIPEDRPLDLKPDIDKITNFLAPEQIPNATTPAHAPSMAAIADLAPGPDMASAVDALKSSSLREAVSDQQLVLPASPMDRTLEGLDGKLLEKLNNASEAGDGSRRTPGFSNLEDLLARGGSVNSSTAPIMLPTDLLFEYGSDELAEGARLSLMKLGYLITKNPNSRFIIEGHTDTIGSEIYNIDLSQRRANAVVGWLMRSLRLSNDRIDAVGMGESRPLPNVNPNGTQEEQAMNRRVEIKVRPLSR